MGREQMAEGIAAESIEHSGREQRNREYSGRAVRQRIHGQRAE
jgi:hypothetical protein